MKKTTKRNKKLGRKNQTNWLIYFRSIFYNQKLCSSTFILPVDGQRLVCATLPCPRPAKHSQPLARRRVICFELVFLFFRVAPLALRFFFNHFSWAFFSASTRFCYGKWSFCSSASAAAAAAAVDVAEVWGNEWKWCGWDEPDRELSIRLMALRRFGQTDGQRNCYKWVSVGASNAFDFEEITFFTRN